MSTISIRRNHQLTPARASEVAEMLGARMAKDYGVTSRWQGSALHFERTGLRGVLTLNPGQLAVEVQLGFLLTPMRDRIAKGIESKLDEEFADVSVRAEPGAE